MHDRTDPNTRFTIGRYIRESRAEVRMSIRRASMGSGISARKYRQIETGEWPLDPDTLWAIIQVLQMRPAEAFQCAGYPGARQLPASLMERPRALSQEDVCAVQAYLDIIAGRDQTEHGGYAA